MGRGPERTSSKAHLKKGQKRVSEVLRGVECTISGDLGESGESVHECAESCGLLEHWDPYPNYKRK